jgi:citrate lyase subunit beta/citryl-CoA lyase
MRDDAKPLRTMMYVPANKEDWVRKAPKYGADALILDLEDSVPPEEKNSAREIISRLIPELASSGVTVMVRVNDLETGLTEDDLSFAIQYGTYAITLPMVKGPRDILALDELITKEESVKGIQYGTVLVDPGLETATGMRSAYDIGISSQRVAHMGAGGGRGGDIARSIGYRWTPEGTETLFVRSKVLLDSRAAEVPYPMTGLWQDVNDHDGLKSFANHSRDLGYSGMTVIHPSHVPIVNQIFSPSQEEIREWQGLVAAMKEVRKLGGAAISYQGGMVDIAHEKTALQMLDLARKLDLVEG